MLCGKPVRNCLDSPQWYWSLLAKRLPHSIGILGFHAVNSHFRALFFDSHGNPGNQPTTTDGNVNFIYLRQAFQEFQSYCPLPGNEHRIGKGMNWHEAAFQAELVNFLLPDIRSRPTKDDVGTEFLEQRNFVRL